MSTEAKYEIARPTGVCAATGRAIAPGEPFVAVLVEAGSAGEESLQRRDYHAESWADGAVLAELKPAPRVLGHWRAVMPEPNASGRTIIDDEALADLFEQSLDEGGGGDDDPSRASFRFVLALLLVRRKLLKPAGSSEGALVLRWARDGDRATPFEVPDPGMDGARIAQAAERLSAVLLGGDPGQGR
ncbi:MAG: hypothetical protein ACKVU4_12315 [Phycisphaerales bacterium]